MRIYEKTDEMIVDDYRRLHSGETPNERVLEMLTTTRDLCRSSYLDGLAGLGDRKASQDDCKITYNFDADVWGVFINAMKVNSYEDFLRLKAAALKNVAERNGA